MSPDNISRVENTFIDIAKCYRIGKTIINKQILIKFNDMELINESIIELRDMWEETSYKLELLQANNECVIQERNNFKNRTIPKIYINSKIVDLCKNYTIPVISKNLKPKVVILRDEGSNGEREMAAAFYIAGFDVLDITMNDLIDSKEDILSKCVGIAFVGGFTYSDVFGAGIGWYNVIKSNEKISKQFDRFYNRDDTFSFGVCNGCQLMALLKWIPYNCKFIKNKSERFESRFSIVKIRESPAIMLKDMTGCTMGIWVAHGEGQITIDQPYYIDDMTPIQYVNDDGYPTEEYPFNPNGSTRGITAVCSENGRHLAMMPHPERCFMNWQLPWVPNNYPLEKDGKSPWIAMFYNAYKWCIGNSFSVK